MSRRPINLTGIQKHGTGYLAVVSHGRGSRTRKWFPATTPMSVIVDWRLDTAAVLRLTRHDRAGTSTFAHDARRYLDDPNTKQMPSYADRVREIAKWTAAFGTRARSTITAAHIRACRDAWITQPRSATDTRPLAHATANRLVWALSSMYRTLDGHGSKNPARDVDQLREPAPVQRDLDAGQLDRLIDAMTDLAVPIAGQKRAPGSKTKARVRVMAHTGLPPGTLQKIARDDVDFAAGTLRLPRRLKGSGVSGKIVPISADAVAAFRALDKLGAWGRFSRQALRKSVHAAARRANIGHLVNPYDLRKTFATRLGAASGDEVAVAELLGHADVATTRKVYTLGSHFDRARKALDSLTATGGNNSETGDSVATSVATCPKSSGPRKDLTGLLPPVTGNPKARSLKAKS